MRLGAASRPGRRWRVGSDAGPSPPRQRPADRPTRSMRRSTARRRRRCMRARRAAFALWGRGRKRGRGRRARPARPCTGFGVRQEGSCGSMFAERLLARSDRRTRLDIEARARPWRHGRLPIRHSALGHVPGVRAGSAPRRVGFSFSEFILTPTGRGVQIGGRSGRRPAPGERRETDRARSHSQPRFGFHLPADP